MLALDTETHRFGPGNMAPRLVCLTTSTGHIWPHDEAGEIFEAILGSSASPIVGHNIAYDLAVAAANYPHLLPAIFDAYEADRVEDTSVRQKLIDIARGRYRGYTKLGGQVIKIGYKLADLALRHLGLELDKTTWRTGYAELDGIPASEWPEGARRYAIDDAITTGRVWEAQQAELPLLGDQHRQARAAFWLHLMGAWGIHTDAKRVREYAGATRKEYAEIARDLQRAGLIRPDKVLKSGPRKGTVIEGSRDTKAAGARLEAAYARRGLAVPLTPTGKPQLDDTACITSGDPLLASYARLSSLKRTIAEILPVLEAGVATPLHSRFEVLMETGRTSSSNPQLQNLPRTPGIRECFVPRPGYVFASADYSGMELHTLAQVCVSLFGKSRLAEALNAGVDPHLMVAATILGCTYAEAVARHAAGDEAVDTARQVGKVANFGFPGGLGVLSMVEYAKSGHCCLTEEQARTLKQQWLATWPELQAYFRFVGDICDADEPVIEQLFSRRFRGNVIYTAACNGLFQGLAADAAKAAGWLIARACYVDTSSVLYGCRMVNFIHDEFILEVPDDEHAHDCAVELERLMCAGAAPWLPDVPPKAEPQLMRYWSKKAKSVYKEGRLVPWT